MPYLVVGRWGVTPFPAPTPMRFIVGEPLSAVDAGSMVRRPPCMPIGAGTALGSQEGDAIEDAGCMGCHRGVGRHGLRV